MNDEDRFFGHFDMERICIDKVFFTVYDKKYSTINHQFDKDLRDKFIMHVKRSRIKSGRFSEVIRKENDYSSWELRLNGSRTMYFHVNIIHLLQQMHNIKPKHVIYDDNFLPVDDTLELIDHISAFRDFVNDAKRLYYQMVKKYWDTELDNIMVKFVQVEIPYEIYPASVEDITDQLRLSGIAFKKYNSQSGTLYLTPDLYGKDKAFDKSNSLTFPDRKYDKDFKVPDSDLSIKETATYINNINSGLNDHKTQIKIYQKTFGLVRIELTVYSDDAKGLFAFDSIDSDGTIANTLTQFVNYVMRINDLSAKRYDRSLDDIVRFLACAFKENEDLIYSLKDIDIFESCRANKTIRQRLVRKGLLLKKIDSNGRVKFGVYLVNPIIRDFLQMYKPKGNEHFLETGLCATL